MNHFNTVFFTNTTGSYRVHIVYIVMNILNSHIVLHPLLSRLIPIEISLSLLLHLRNEISYSSRYHGICVDYTLCSIYIPLEMFNSFPIALIHTLPLTPGGNPCHQSSSTFLLFLLSYRV